MSEDEQGVVSIGPWQRLSRREVYDNPWISVLHDEVRLPTGGTGIYGVVHLKNRATGAVIFDDDDRILMVGQHRYPFDEWSWELPEGGVPSGEDLDEGIKREVREETGVEAVEWQQLASLQLSNSVSDEVAYLYLARAHVHGEPDPEPTEELEVRWMPFDEVLAMTLDGRITDVMTVVAVQRVALMRAVGQ